MNLSSKEGYKQLVDKTLSLITTHIYESSERDCLEQILKESVDYTFLKEIVGDRKEVMRVRFRGNDITGALITQIQVETGYANTVSWITLQGDQVHQLAECLKSALDTDIEGGKKKTILAVRCAQCDAVYMANNLTHGMAEWVGEDIKEVLAKGDEVFLTDCATMKQCKCDKITK